MDTLDLAPVAGVLTRLFDEAATADGALMAQVADGWGDGDPVAEILAREAVDYRGLYHGFAANYLNVSAEFGQFLYVCARARQARNVVEFGTSFGISTIYLAAALRDNGGGRLVGTELEPTKARRAMENLAAAGLADLVDVRVGDALETLRDDIEEVDLVLLDGAFSLYLPVLHGLEHRLRPGALVVGENASGDYLRYVRDPRNGYRSVALPFDAGRGNELSVRTA
ncbi:class I SAM-dependent methyltransferase [Mycobacterium yunnanensis]|uniref:Class I SAM-dependent methyltransferase n=1 Tax=Mycobacterium yunnanensis TaxID=368477 RepID=A0A9X3C397_9MYCO|nr:class I SAM-dependent methyltransferase [Mycobacterium yunnanensis]MCV7421717.1 class I SAM-dependent methyltransferase [Mycobacterium yunnanensis]